MTLNILQILAILIPFFLFAISALYMYGGDQRESDLERNAQDQKLQGHIKDSDSRMQAA